MMPKDRTRLSRAARIVRKQYAWLWEPICSGDYTMEHMRQCSLTDDHGDDAHPGCATVVLVELAEALAAQDEAHGSLRDDAVTKAHNDAIDLAYRVWCGWKLQLCDEAFTHPDGMKFTQALAALRRPLPAPLDAPEDR